MFCQEKIYGQNVIGSWSVSLYQFRQKIQINLPIKYNNYFIQFNYVKNTFNCQVKFVNMIVKSKNTERLSPSQKTEHNGLVRQIKNKELLFRFTTTWRVTCGNNY